MHKIRVKLKGFDHRVLDKATDQICKNVTDTGAKVRGPVPLPNKRWKIAVLKGPHIDKKAMDHLGYTEHFRLLDILGANANTIDTLTHMQVPAGVDIEIK